MTEQMEMFEKNDNNIMNQKGLFTFTGNPIIDNGMAVLTNITNEKNIEKINPQKIIDNVPIFFGKIKNKYNDLNASSKELKHIKKKLKQHFYSIYTTNHYLHGINNKSSYIINATIKTEQFDDLIRKIKITYPSININILDQKKGKCRIYNKNKTYLAKENFINCINKIYQKKYRISNYSLSTVEDNEEYFASFIKKIEDVLNNKSKIFTDKKRICEHNICNFCGKKSDILLSKDIFPLTSAMGDFNHGRIYICKFCYIAILFAFIGYINFKKEVKKSGMYFLYHFSNPNVMLEHIKLQIQHLQKEKLSSLQTYIGGKYSSIFDDLFIRSKLLESIKKYNPSVTVYILLNDNRGAQYETITLPSGVLNFWIFLQSTNLHKEWAMIHSKLNNEQDYINFKNGIINFKKYLDDSHQPILKIETIKSYLEEVSKMNKELFNICEDLAKNLIKYYKKLHERKPNHRKNWVEEFYDFFNVSLKKPWDFFNYIYQYNNEYFRWTEGENLIDVTSSKILLESSKKYNLLYGLIEYLILNSLNDVELKKYNDYVKSK
ncbi:MAG: hypothetical protein ACOCWG_00930 [bacterium]